MRWPGCRDGRTTRRDRDLSKTETIFVYVSVRAVRQEPWIVLFTRAVFGNLSMVMMCFNGLAREMKLSLESLRCVHHHAKIFVQASSQFGMVS
jgi:hypothetical protein